MSSHRNTGRPLSGLRLVIITCPVGAGLSTVTVGVRAQQIPLLTSASEVPGPALGTRMTTA